MKKVLFLSNIFKAFFLMWSLNLVPAKTNGRQKEWIWWCSCNASHQAPTWLDSSPNHRPWWDDQKQCTVIRPSQETERIKKREKKEEVTIGMDDMQPMHDDSQKTPISLISRAPFYIKSYLCSEDEPWWSSYLDDVLIVVCIHAHK